MTIRTGGILGIILLGALTVAAIVSDGSSGFPAAILFNLTALQVWIDLVIAVVFWCAWLVPDARSHGRNPWPWIIAALIVGCFAPLAYMIVYQRWPASPSSRGQREGGNLRRRILAGLVLVLFALLTVGALNQDGTDIAATVTRTFSHLQIWVDLVIAIILWVFWVYADTRRRGASPWPWIVFALLLGAFAPLAYLVFTGRWPASHPIPESV